MMVLMMFLLLSSLSWRLIFSETMNVDFIGVVVLGPQFCFVVLLPGNKTWLLLLYEA